MADFALLAAAASQHRGKSSPDRRSMGAPHPGSARSVVERIADSSGTAKNDIPKKKKKKPLTEEEKLLRSARAANDAASRDHLNTPDQNVDDGGYLDMGESQDPEAYTGTTFMDIKLPRQFGIEVSAMYLPSIPQTGPHARQFTDSLSQLHFSPDAVATVRFGIVRELLQRQRFLKIQGP